MKTLDLSAAAECLGLHPKTLQARAKAGEIPGAKIGKHWRFLELDLIEYIRAHYPDKRGGNQCRSIKSGRRGMPTSSITASAFAEALGLPIGGKRSDSTTNLKPRSGLKLVSKEPA